MKRLGLSRLLLSLLLFVMLALAVSCSKERVKRTPEEANIAKEAMEVVNAIRSAYMAADPERIKVLSVSDEVLKYFSFLNIPSDLEFMFRWVELYDSKVEVYVSWKATKKIGGSPSQERGLCLFVLEGKPFKLKRIMRENPFIQ